METDEQWRHDIRQRLLAQWQDGMTCGLIAAAEVAERQGHHQLAQDIRDTTVRYVTTIARPLPVDAYDLI